MADHKNSLDTTIILELSNKIFHECRALLDDEPNAQTGTNVIFTIVDTAARLWIYAKQRGIDMPPFEPFSGGASQLVHGYADVIRKGGTVFPPKPTGD